MQTTLTGGPLHKCSAQRSSAITVHLLSPFICYGSSAINDHLIEFAARDLRPLSIVKGKGFKRLIKCLEPLYKVPSRTHVTTVCHRKSESLKEKLLASLSSVDNVSLTTDIWTSRATQAFLTITAHFLVDWKLESKVPSTAEIPEQHTGINIGDRLRLVSNNWKIYKQSLGFGAWQCCQPGVGCWIPRWVESFWLLWPHASARSEFRPWYRHDLPLNSSLS